MPIADLLGAERAVSASFAALRSRERGELGTQRVVLQDAARDAGSAVRHGLTGPDSLLGGALPNYSIYRAADGYVAVGALEPHFAARLAEHIGNTREELSSRFATEPRKHWEEVGITLDIPIVAVQSAAPDQSRS